MDQPERKPVSETGRQAFDLSGLFGAKIAAQSVRTGTAEAFWDQVQRDPRAWNVEMRGYDGLIAIAAEATAEDLRRTLGWLEASLNLCDRLSALAACRYLYAMPETALASEYARLLSIFNSRKVGMAWQLTPDLDKKPLPRGPIPAFGVEAGFGLIRHTPELYRKLAMLGYEMEEVVIGLVEEATHYGISLPPDLLTLASARQSPPKV